jgi:tRNA(fMet)-specific endonuclease VapC
MIYLLDTNTCIGYLSGRVPSIRQKLRELSPTDVAVCSVVKAELFYGAMKSIYPMQTLQRQQDFLRQFISLPFDDEATLFYGQIRARLESVGTPIGPYDLQIAAIALVHNLILVTHNTREFGRVEGLAIKDWEAN